MLLGFSLAWGATRSIAWVVVGSSGRGACCDQRIFRTLPCIVTPHQSAQNGSYTPKRDTRRDGSFWSSLAIQSHQHIRLGERAEDLQRVRIGAAGCTGFGKKPFKGNKIERAGEGAVGQFVADPFQLAVIRYVCHAILNKASIIL